VSHGYPPLLLPPPSSLLPPAFCVRLLFWVSPLILLIHLFSLLLVRPHPLAHLAHLRLRLGPRALACAVAFDLPLSPPFAPFPFLAFAPLPLRVTIACAS
jgi:hypothetical protein